MKIKSIKENIEKIKGKTVLLRVDFNVPVDKKKITDEKKIISALPTIRFLMRYQCKIVLATHLGRPEKKGKKDLSTKILAEKLEKILKTKESKNKKVYYIDQVVGENSKQEVKKIKPGEIVFLENLRFDSGEKKNEKKFAKKLASLADLYVNDAFSVSHRQHASVSAIKDYLPSFAGFLLEEEIKNLDKIKNPQKPLITVIGGIKVETKEKLIKNLLPKAEKILLGGGLANNFLAARGYEVGKSLVSDSSIELAKKILRKNKEKIIFPLDVVVSSEQDGGGKAEVKRIGEIGYNDYIYDIGPETVRFFSKFIKKANSIIWNGPLGWFENKNFNQGTLMTARLIATRSKGRAFGVAGGGETVKALKESGMEDYMDWISTGGGAMLTYLGEGKMPGIKKLIKY